MTEEQKKKFFISEVWYLSNRLFAFQRVGTFWNLYDHNGDFIKEFRSFYAMTQYIEESEVWNTHGKGADSL